MIAYKIDNNVYINLTNKCSNNCSFCVRTTSNAYEQYDLWLDKEPETKEVIEALNEYMGYENFVFCGYGEPLYRLETLMEVAEYLKRNNKKVRLNTNGQAKLIKGEGVASKLVGKIDEVSISLNAGNAKAYNDICDCQFGEEGFNALIEFASECKNLGITTKFTVVKAEGVDVDEAIAIAKQIGIPLRVRELIL